MRVPIAADHAGFACKQAIVEYMIGKQSLVLHDLGCFSADACDYPDFAHRLASAVHRMQFPWGVLICGSGNGMAIVANRYENVRAALCWNVESARLARQHNDANILCIPARFVSPEEALRIFDAFASTTHEGGRHAFRVGKINANR